MSTNSGCLPPTRAENAHGLFFGRYRLQVSSEEAANLPHIKQPNPNEQTNQLPSWIGRAFRATSIQRKGPEPMVFRAPSVGNLDFIPLGDFDNPPEIKLKTESLVTTDISGAVFKQLDLAASANAGGIVAAALKIQGIPPEASSKLEKVLHDYVASAQTSKSSAAAAAGTYYYVSLKNRDLDSLTRALGKCNLSPSIDIESDIIVRTTMPGRDEDIGSAPNAPDLSCLATIESDTSFSPAVKTLIKAIKDASLHRDMSALGIVIGVAILKTTKGSSDICNQSELGLITSGSMNSNISPTCMQLRNSIQQFQYTDSTGSSKFLDNLTQGNLMLKLNAAYTQAYYKSLQIQEHTSVLAVHWIPVLLK